MRLLLAILLLTSTQMSTQMVLPALPNIAAHFHLAPADAQQIIMLYYISFGVSQIFYGPWVDAVGQRRVFYTGLGLFLSGSLLCFWATTPDLFAIGRILQGAGAGAPLILSRVILSRRLSGESLKKAYGSLAIAASMASIAAPFLGGLITSTYQWQLVFLALIVYLLVSLLVGHKLLPAESPVGKGLSLRGAARDYALLICDRRFIAAGSFKWLPTLMFMSLGTFLPFEMQRRFGLSAEQYGSAMVIPVFGALFGSTCTRILQRRFGSRSIIGMFWPLLVLAGLMLLFGPRSMNAIWVAVTLFMVLSGAYYSNSLQLVMAPFPEKAGTASALVGSIDMCVISLLAGLINRFWIKSSADLGALFMVCALLIATSWIVLKLNRATEATPQSAGRQADCS